MSKPLPRDFFLLDLPDFIIKSWINHFSIRVIKLVIFVASYYYNVIDLNDFNYFSFILLIIHNNTRRAHY